MTHHTRSPVVALGAAVAVGLLPFLAYSPIDAQQASIKGRVMSLVDGSSVEGAAVRLRGTGGPHETVTNGAGLFRFEDLSGGQYELTLSYLGTDSKVFPVALGRRQSLALEFDLEMRVVPVPELVVNVSEREPVGKLYDFYRRAERGPGHFITRQEIEERHASRTSDILRSVPGLDVTPRPGFDRTPITMGRRKGCVPDFYVDGAHAPYFNVDNLQPVDVAGIEVYRGNSEVPVEFKHADRCGVIVLWTRDPSNWRGFQ